MLQKALYGLRESPRAWSIERDKTMRQLEFQWNGKLVWLEQCKCEPGAWRIHTGARRSTPCTNNVFNDVEGEGLVVPARTWGERIENALREVVEEYEVKSELVGWVLAYVDDLLMVTWKGDEVLEDDVPGDKLQREIETRWKCGRSQILAPENLLEYTGIEIRKSARVPCVANEVHKLVVSNKRCFEECKEK